MQTAQPAGTTWGVEVPFVVATPRVRAMEAVLGYQATAGLVFGAALPALALPTVDFRVVPDLLRLSLSSLAVKRTLPLQVDDGLTCRVTWAGKTEHATGTLLLLEGAVTNQRAHTVAHLQATLLLRGARRRRELRAQAEETAQQHQAFLDKPECFSAALSIGGPVLAAWADAIGQREPMSLNDDVARLAGLPRALVPHVLLFARVEDLLREAALHGEGRFVRAQFIRPALVDDPLVLSVRGSLGARSFRLTGVDNDVILAGTLEDG